jgi:drug/metabolite transporter (DMT)-like permease
LTAKPATVWTGPLWALLAAVVWALTMIVLARLVGTITPPTLACIRFAVAALLLGLWLARSNQWPRLAQIAPRDRWLLALAAAGLAANYVFSVKALSHVTAAESSVLSLMNGVLFMGCGVLFLHERLSRWQSVGVALFFAGLGLFLLPRLTGSDFDARFAHGTALVAIASTVWLAYALVQRLVQRRLTSLQVLWLVCCGAALWLLPLVSTAGFDQLGPGGWVALGLSCACTLVAYSAYAQALQHWTVSGATIVTSLQPVLVWWMSVAAAGLGVAGVVVPQVGPLGVAGALLAIAGCALAALGKRAPPALPDSSP